MPWNVYALSFRAWESLLEGAAYSLGPRWKECSSKLVVYDGLAWMKLLCHPVEKGKIECIRGMSENGQSNATDKQQWWQLNIVIRLTMHIWMPQGMSLSLSHSSRSAQVEILEHKQRKRVLLSMCKIRNSSNITSLWFTFLHLHITSQTSPNHKLRQRRLNFVICHLPRQSEIMHHALVFLFSTFFFR